MNRLVVGALALIASLALAACGDDDDRPSGSATPSAEPTASGPAEETISPSSGRTSQEVTFVDSSGGIWLAPADGGEPTLFVDTGDECPNPTEIIWSPDGEHLACFGFDAATHAPRLAVYGPDGGLRYSEDSLLSAFAWSPEGERFVYTVTEDGVTDLIVRSTASGDEALSVGTAEAPVWAPDGRLAAFRPSGTDIGGSDTPFLDIYDGAEATAIPGDFRPLAWVLGGEQVLVATNFAVVSDLGGPTFEANLLDPATGATTRVPELDNRAGLFWVSPDGATAVFVQSQADPPELAVIDFATLAVTPIAESRIGFPSHFIPSEHLAFAPDSETVYWTEVTTQADVYAAALNGVSATPLATLDEAILLEFSPDRARIAYLQAGDPASLWTANVDGSRPTQIAAPVAAFAWRPLPPNMDASAALKPSESDTPAAGVCFGPGSTDVVTVMFYTSISSPRCARALPSQRLRVVNMTDETIDAWLGTFEAEIAPGGEATSADPLGQFLDFGVHTLRSDAYVAGLSASIWLECSGSVVGRVMLDYGDRGPAVGEWIQITGMPGDPLGEYKRVAVAEDGTFRVNGVPEGFHQGYARHARFEFEVRDCGEVVGVGVVEYPLVHSASPMPKP